MHTTRADKNLILRISVNRSNTPAAYWKFIKLACSRQMHHQMHTLIAMHFLPQMFDGIFWFYFRNSANCNSIDWYCRMWSPNLNGLLENNNRENANAIKWNLKNKNEKKNCIRSCNFFGRSSPISIFDYWNYIIIIIIVSTFHQQSTFFTIISLFADN